MRAFAQAERFVSELESRKLRPAYVFVGDEAFFRKRFRDAILEHLHEWVLSREPEESAHDGYRGDGRGDGPPGRFTRAAHRNQVEPDSEGHAGDEQK